GVAAITSATIGGSWDVAWHRSIGRDSFWTPAHMMIYLCGVLAGIVGLWLVAQTTFGRNADLRSASVSVFGLRAPLGVFLMGGAAWPCSPPRPLITGGTTPTGWTSRSSRRRTPC